MRDDAAVTTAIRRKANGPFFAEAVTVNRLARELYDFWRNPANLGRFMENIESIDVLDERRSHWRV